MITLAEARSGKVKIENAGWDLIGDHPANAHVEIVDATQCVLDVKGRTKWAIIGFASATRMLAPFDDPEWIVMGLNQLYRHVPRADVWIEIHTREVFVADTVRDTDYVKWLQECQIPVVMLECQPDMPASVRFPIEDAIKWQCGRDYFQSTIAYMVHVAVRHGAEEIGIWGVDLVVGTEYEKQKPNLEWLLGICEARGIKVTLPEDTALLKQRYRYGPEIKSPMVGPFSLDVLNARHKKMCETRDQMLTQLNGVEGHILENRAMFDMLELYERGAKVEF